MSYMGHSTDELLTTQDAAELLNVTYRTIRRWCAAGKLPAQRTSGGWWVIRRQDVEKLKEARKND